MSSRTHDRDHFFKYATLKTAMRVLETKSFRWSDPTKFNDPFDHQSGFVLGFGSDVLAATMFAALERIIFSEADPNITPNSLFSALTLRMRSIRHKLPRVEVLPQLYETCKESAAIMQSSLINFNKDLLAQFCHSRVFCVSERHDNVVMWSHYADTHKGVVFKLRCIDELDNTLLAARKVSYTDSFLPFPIAERYVKHLTGEQPLDLAALAWDIVITKHLDWSYEKEWRVHIPLLDEPPGDGYAFFKEDPRIFEAIYLGCRMDDNEVTAIVEHSRQHLPGTKIFRGAKNATAFTLSFTEINEI